MIQCPNPACQAANNVGQTMCQVCQTPLIHRFLWVADNDLSGFQSGSLIADRFQVWASRIVLDTRPGQDLPALEEVPDTVRPYLRLANRPLQVPKPFTVLSDGAGSLLLLEDAPLAIQTDRSGKVTVEPLPTLADRWVKATPLRQLNWLRQIAQLWPALAEAGVAASLLETDLLRVDGSVLRLLALRPSQQRLALTDVGHQWQGLLTTAHPAIEVYLKGLIAQLNDRTLATAADLEQSLDQAIARLFQAQPIRLETATLTDQGPSRSRNEDACYPDSGSVTQGTVQAANLPDGLSPLVIVCDGIGGHESGNVASQLAIQTVQQQLTPLLKSPNLSPAEVTKRLEQAISTANDAIAQRNDQEHRQERGRMGTTLVFALIYPPYLYVAHLGDSRAYRISAQTCCQITLDDDVAARETKLGYALYRDALNFPNAGALVQALGIGESGYLQPTVQHFLLDDDSLFLICSDGLSDFERVESFWFSMLRPAVLGQVGLGQVGQQLINLANGYNGHDNVTVGLVTLSPQAAQSFAQVPAGLSNQAREAPLTDPATKLQDTTQVPAAATVIQPPSPPTKRRVAGAGKLWLLGLAAIAAAGLGALWRLSQTQPDPQPLQSLPPEQSPPPPQVNPASPVSQAVTVNSLWQVRTSGSGTTRLTLQAAAEPDLATPPAPESAPLIPAGSILKVISRRATPDSEPWVRLQVCSMPSGGSLADPPAETGTGATVPPNPAPADLSEGLLLPGAEGWISEPLLTATAVPISEITPTQQGVCP